MANNWAIAIGVNKYQNLPSLNYAVTDAEKMRDWFVHEAGFDSKRVYLFTDNSPLIVDAGPPYSSQPTYATLIRFLTNRFKQQFLSTGDNLWFFFSGHGFRHAERDYLMLSDSSADLELIDKTAISLSFVTERLRHSGADNVVLFLDACRSDLKTKGAGVGEEPQPGVITFASCSPAERSYEIELLQQGSFTYALLESLRLQGEGNCATVERLYQRLRYRVSEINQQYKKPRQTPYAMIEPATKYHLILLPKQATLQDVATLKLYAQDAELEKDLKLAEQLWTRILTVSPADPQALKGLKRIWIGTEGKPPQPQPPESPKLSSKSPADKREFSLHPDFPSLSVFNFEIVGVNAKGKQIKKESKQSQYFSEDLGNGITLEMVAIPGGTFTMGTEDEEIERLVKKFNWDGFRSERPQHRVTVSSFYMGRYPITQAQWRAIAATAKIDIDLETNPSRFIGDELPVERVNWYEATEFCKRLSRETKREYRLPSEAEWEYACRAGTTTPFYFGETITGELANYNAGYTYAGEAKGEYRQQTTPVGQFPPNAFGLYDMHGNVWEWCADTWHDNYDGAPRDGSVWIKNGDDNRSPLRGGSWYNNPNYCRSAYRDYYNRRDDSNFIFGFRVVCGAGRTL
ncbi:SUMF1/EgtB/PvdO family nonheme iron enzyme [Microcystis aeruginosa]|uniref:SUMF1/EgtB/PvdO family nonheme iron enzyme n=1 Tax=Microcystis aeruginosa TaxID=1126 RepID=UPI0023309B80|nr:SUMF1/EgtB/PvdO family nonheme iron enzyme [Microcystis aeruginosa]MDB9391060.1 SUMF1/EgtB/PvdO family nonheme iron enzyme [Microcystis aeruginosa CS-579]